MSQCQRGGGGGREATAQRRRLVQTTHDVALVVE